MTILTQAVRDTLRDWQALVATGLIYRLITAAVLSPLVGLLLRYFVTRSGSAALTDADIAVFLLTTGPGIAGLIVAAAVSIAIVALEQKALMAIGLGRLRGHRVRVRDALLFAASRTWSTIRLAVLLTVRIILLVLPFAALLGAVYWFLLRAHDINYYIADRPREFWIAVALAGVILLALAVVLAKRIANWLVALPLVAFERAWPHTAFAESARRMLGRRKGAAATLLVLAAAWLGISLASTSAIIAAGRWAAPAFGASVTRMLLFIGVFMVAWVLVGLLLSITMAAVFAQVVVRYYADGAPANQELADISTRLAAGGRRLEFSWPLVVGGLVLGVIGGAVLARVFMQDAWRMRPVLVMAHRGASGEAPENTLAAFRLAGEQGTDYVELDVQESSDGVVLVAHDADLMKVGRSPLRIWQSPADSLRAIDIGSFFNPSFASERLPTLQEALEVSRGKSKVNIELKDYGHDDRLEARVVELVEAAGMQDQIVTMSLSHKMVLEMERLRPQWTSGLLLARAVGDPSKLEADFLAVPASVATRRFIRHAHARGKPVYAWTVNDPHQMVRLIGYGVDGLITNYPARAKEVIATYDGLDPAQRLVLFVMTRLGSAEPIAQPDSLLRP